MLGQNSLNRCIENTILRNLLPHIMKNQQYYKQLANLGRISSIYYSMNEKPAIKQKKRCLICEQSFQNLLMLILHLEIKHQNGSIKVQRYQYTYDVLTIYLKTCNKTEQKPNFSFLVNFTKKDSFLQFSMSQRVKMTIDNIINKLQKKILQIQRVYFHSYDVFRQISPASEDQNSQEQTGMIQQQLQKLKICEFNDVNQNDKLFFMKWNELIHSAKRKYNIMDQNVMMKVLTKLVSVCKKFNIPRMNLIIHLWTLWSSGKIQGANIITIISLFDQQQKNIFQNQN